MIRYPPANRSNLTDLATLTPNGETAEAALNNGSLRELAKKSNEATIARKLYESLLEKGVGTNRVEKEAYALEREKGKLKQERKMRRVMWPLHIIDKYTKILIFANTKSYSN